MLSFQNVDNCRGFYRFSIHLVALEICHLVGSKSPGDGDRFWGQLVCAAVSDGFCQYIVCILSLDSVADVISLCVP